MEDVERELKAAVERDEGVCKEYSKSCMGM